MTATPAERAAAHAARVAVRTAIDACGDCDPYGRLDDLSDCGRHPNFRHPDVSLDDRAHVSKAAE